MSDLEEFANIMLDLTPPRDLEVPHDNIYTFKDSGISLHTPIHIQTDSAPGCGGKIWESGEMMCDYIIEKLMDPESKFSKLHENRYRNIIELGTGTGIVSLLLGELHNEGYTNFDNVDATDITALLPLLEENIKHNNMENIIHAKELWWGQAIDKKEFDLNKVDLILAADCVYHECLFEILIETFMNLTEVNQDTPILLAYKKRRNADKRFFQKLKKHFICLDLSNFRMYEHAKTHKMHMYLITRKKRDCLD
ncbi:hypothetical protein ACO0RG_001215 [Hanseniaspora osmophila]|uniref:Protein-lysine N-methyltransferase EFM6 n=1 Tax=Hanseniaspora osmophila TaxID=56408 RepID=A0A1E5RND5_9ASCO|nr:Protein-lysine N-methyltransferase EFM6 [Hanseniaspora osmophila]